MLTTLTKLQSSLDNSQINLVLEQSEGMGNQGSGPTVTLTQFLSFSTKPIISIERVSVGWSSAY